MENINLHKYYLILLLIGLSTLIGMSQESSFEHFKQVQARNIGPAGMSGRVTAIDVNLSDPSMIYVGTASGGVWLSDNGGVDWRPIFKLIRAIHLRYGLAQERVILAIVKIVAPEYLDP